VGEGGHCDKEIMSGFIGKVGGDVIPPLRRSLGEDVKWIILG
jgi:hypothetical protein